MEGAGRAGRGRGGLHRCSWNRAASWSHITFILIVSTGLPSLMAGLGNDVVTRGMCYPGESELHIPNADGMLGCLIFASHHLIVFVELEMWGGQLSL